MRIGVRTIVRQFAQRVLRVIRHKKYTAELRLEIPKRGMSTTTTTNLPADLGEKAEASGRLPSPSQKITPTKPPGYTRAQIHR